jgi:hypothetical protein
LARHFQMPRGSRFSLIVGTGVLCAMTAGSVTAASWPTMPSAGNHVAMADVAIVTHAQSPSLPPAAINATATRQARRGLLARQAAATAAAARRASSGSGSSPATVAPAVVGGAPGSAQQIAQQMLDAVGQGGQFSCLDSLWSRESDWSASASNPGTGAYGIPQALPGVKMASAGLDWQTDAATQIRWGLSYINSLYGSPCGAWSHEESAGWY